MAAPDTSLSRQAFNLYQSGRVKEAEPLFRRLRDGDPDDWQFEMMVGLCRYSSRDLDKAEKHLRRACELGDGQAATHFYLGRLMLDRGKPREARGEFAQAIGLNPNHVEARTGMGQAALMQGDFKRAVSELKTALRASERHVPALALLARALVEQGEAASARPYAQRAVELESGNSLAHDALGRAFMAEGHPRLAEQSFRNALKHNPRRPDTLAALGDALSAQRRDREALEQYQQAVQSGQGSPALFVRVAETLERAGDRRQALTLLDQALQRWPGDAVLVVARARQARRDGDLDRVASLLESAGADRPELKLEHARLAQAQGRPADAREQVEALLDELGDAAPVEARPLLARVLYEQAMAEPDADADAALDAAREALAPLLDRPQPDPNAWIAWADMCERVDRWSLAIEALESVLSRDEYADDARARLSCWLGNLYDSADQPAEAWDHWSRGGWREAPQQQRLNAQEQLGLLPMWLEAPLDDWPDIEFDDRFRAPVIVAGWPGSGRELLIEALRAHPEVETLDRDGDVRRMEALGLPLMPESLSQRDADQLRLGRRRFLRGVDRNNLPEVVLDPGWWEASALPTLLRHFPDLTVILPEADAADLAVQWRSDGYRDPDPLMEIYRQEQALWTRLRERFDFNVIEVSRAVLLDHPESALAPVLDALDLEADPTPAEAATRLVEAHRRVPAGRGERYDPPPAGDAA